jgi:dTMP kinase
LAGKLITLEGIDGSGKSTQMEILARELTRRKFDVVTTMEPGGTPLGKRLREIFLETEDEIAPRAELLLFAADRAQHVDFLIKPAIEQNKIVISDRFADATYAYQGAGRGFSVDTVNSVIELATDGLKPDLTLFYDVPVSKALGRAGSRKGNNRMDSEKAEFYERVRIAYLGIAKREPERFIPIPGDKTVDETHRLTLEVVLSFLNSKTTANNDV